MSENYTPISSIRRILALFLLLLGSISPVFSQAGPYSLPPKWFFGHRAGMDFTGGAPVLMGGNTWEDASIYSNQEGSTVECLPNGNVVYYSNSCRVANSAHTLFGTNPLQGGGNSSSQGCLSIPNPATPTANYYLFMTDVDGSGGSNCSNPLTSRGLYAYPITSAAVIGAPIVLYDDNAQAAGTTLGEFIAASSDNKDGYWIVSHEVNGGGSATSFKVWHLPNTGTINTTPTTTAGSINGANWKYQGGIKFNKCNTRIAFFSNNGFEVRNWNATTGTIGAAIRTVTGAWGIAYGVEFSPDGNILYLSDYNGGLYHYNIGTGTGPTLVSASNSGSGSSQGPGYGNLIIGPDDKIYLSNRYSAGDAPAAGKFLAVIGTPNSATAAGCGFAQTGAGAFQLAAGGANYPSTAAGVITLGWHNPVLDITGAITPTCETFSYTYKQYYGTSIPVNAGSEQWDFGDGNTASGSSSVSHVYATNGTYTITLSVTDQLCSQRYESKKDITISCPMPVELLEFTATKSDGGALLSWATAMELNNDFFEVQHSVDGRNFTTIGTVDGNGTSNVVLNYSFVHATPANGKNYYRLVQHDFNGHFEYSPVKTLMYEELNVSLVPNPSASSFNLYITGADEATVAVIDALGREVFQTQANNEEGLSASFGDNLPKGAYLVKVTTSNGVKTIKALKE